MNLTISNAPRHLWVRLGLLMMAACLVAGVVWVGASTRSDNSGPTTGGEHTPSASATDAAVTHVAPETAPADGVVIPTGTDQSRGYPTGFPATDLGAVGLQVEVAKAQLGFDYDQAVNVAAVYAQSKDRQVFEDRARAAVTARREQAGVPATGDAPAPAAYALTPIAYTLEELETGLYVVNLLSYVTLTTVEGEVEDSLYAGTQLVGWIDGDWRLVRGSEANIDHLLAAGQPEAAAPGTPDFDRAGWQLIGGAPQ